MNSSTSHSAAGRPSRLPSWLVKPLRVSGAVHDLKRELRARRLATVCEEARCPNLGECWERRTATFMILGEVCTRHCSFCSVTAGRPGAVDPEEPRKVAEMIALLGLRHAVITSVARDDLPDGGAFQFARVVECTRKGVARGKVYDGAALASRQNLTEATGPPSDAQCTIEVLTTDFGMNEKAMETVCEAGPDVFNHNLETVERLSPKVRHRASYRDSLEFLRRVKEFAPRILTKSGLMVGLGETYEEVIQAVRDLRAVGCEILTIGQYLRPTTKNLPVVEYVRPEVFRELEERGYEMGFRSVAAGPFVRSSYHAGEML